LCVMDDMEENVWDQIIKKTFILTQK